MTTSATQDLVRTLRDAAPYLLAHRDRTVVVVLPGSLVSSPNLPAWLSDVTLLQCIAGMRFALAFDTVATAVTQGGQATPPLTGFRTGRMAVTDKHLHCLRHAAHDIRELLETHLGLGVPGGLTGTGTATGNPLAAHAVGVVNGQDLGAMGVTKPIPPADAKALLATGKVVLLPPLGNGNNGQLLHLDAMEVALAFATACMADKLVLLITPANHAVLDFRQLTLAQARKALAQEQYRDEAGTLLAIGVAALEQGVSRVHFLNMAEPGSLLLEFLTPDGVAAMLSKDRFDAVRQARDTDAGGIIELIAPGIANGALRPRELREVSGKITNYAVVARDKALIACASLEIHGLVAEFGCLAVRPEHSSQAYGQLLLDFCEAKATTAGVGTLLAVTTQASEWFSERGYTPAQAHLLPRARQAEASSRGSQVLGKALA